MWCLHSSSLSARGAVMLSDRCPSLAGRRNKRDNSLVVWACLGVPKRKSPWGSLTGGVAKARLMEQSGEQFHANYGKDYQYK